MEYISTRGVGQKSLTFEQTVLSGLAPDGGLYIPKRMPELPKDWEARWSGLSFTELALEIYSLFIPTEEISRAELKELIERSYSTFRHPEIAPLKKLTATRYVVELWHGPTFAFKDVALQFLGNLFEFFLNRKNQNRLPKDSPPERITVLGATSGDTGSAAIYGLRGKKDISIFILHPHGRVSPIQEAQMTTVLDDNVFNLAVKGTFDDCQDIVKSLFNDTAFNSTYRLGAINSINWARILAQIVYYFSSYYALRPTLKPNQCLQFIVPTGNFGDILAGFYAHKLGLPMGINGSTPGLVIATNSNDILTRFWETGKYEKQASDDTEQTTVAAGQTAPVLGSSDGKQASDPRHGLVKETLSPAMDILVSSNFERLLFYLAFDTLTDSSKSQDERIEQSQTQVKEWMVQLKQTGRFKVPDSTLQAARALFAAGRVDDQQTQHTILRYFAADKDLLHDGQRYVVDPHTAVGLFVAENLKPSGSEGGAIIQTVLSTAHPAKFGEAVSQSILQSEPARREQFDFERDVLPPQFVGLLDMPRRVIHVPGILPELTKNVVVAHSSPSIPAPNPPSSSV